MRFALVAVFAGAWVAADAQPTSWTNPVLPGDYPDPSVIRVGRTYWATATTSQWAPIFPILKSDDLVRWQTIGAVFPKRPDWAVTNFWAPEIAQHKGRFFVYYTAKRKDGPLCVAVASAAKPQGPYTDHGPLVCQEVGSIDAVPVTGENGKRYLIWKEDGNSRRQPTPLWIQELEDGGTKLTGQPRELFRNDQPWEGQLVEGPYVLRREGWFYLFYSGAGCCGVKCNYALGVARSRSLFGPWEKYAKNPILAGNPDWRCPGHGSIVDNGKGRTFLLYHAYHPEGSIFVGRQGLLDEVTWGPDGWPTIHGGKGPSGGPYTPPRWFADEFAGPGLAPEMQWPAAREWTGTVNNGWLELRPAGESLTAALVAKAPTFTGYTALTRVEGEGVGGLAAYGNERNAVGIAVAPGQVLLWSRRDGSEEILAEVAVKPRPVELRLTATEGKNFFFSYKQPEGSWKALTPVTDRGDLPPWDLAVRVALTAGKAPVRFDFLRIENSVTPKPAQ